MLLMAGKVEHKGFLLKQAFSVDQNLLVMTGKNGVGKTRLLESIKNSQSTVVYLGDELSASDIVYLSNASLSPVFNHAYDDAEYVSKVRHTISFFLQNKQQFVDPYQPEKENDMLMGGRRGHSVLPYGQLYKLCELISRRTNKPVGELTGEDIRLNYEEILESPFVSKNLSLMCNSYLRRIQENEFNVWRATELKKNVSFVSLDKVESFFGPKPWEAINLLVDDVFDGKFKFTVPDEDSENFDYVACLVLSRSGRQVTAEELSSGERTLLWLAITLFNTQYGGALSGAPKLLLIDEPDAYLHPKMVTKLYSVLASFNKVFGGAVIITTHSATTIALGPEDGICVVSEDAIESVSKDVAISELLDGVNQISIDPENRRHVYVESLYDANAYELIYAYFRNDAQFEAGVSLSFVPSGEKMPESRIRDAINSYFDVGEDIVSKVVASINGVGSCNHVIAAVESFGASNNRYVRGVIDWDEGNSPARGIVVFAEKYAYTIENLAFDPISILLMLHLDFTDKYPMDVVCGGDVSWEDWVKNSDLLQLSLDIFIARVLGRVSQCDVELEYTSGLKLLTDREYLMLRGELEERLLVCYPELRSYIKNGRAKDLKYTIINKAMLRLSGGRFIPVQFFNLFKELQRIDPAKCE